MINVFQVFRECVFEIPETAGVSRFRKIALLIPETPDDTGIVQKLSELLLRREGGTFVWAPDTSAQNVLAPPLSEDVAVIP